MAKKTASSVDAWNFKLVLLTGEWWQTMPTKELAAFGYLPPSAAAAWLVEAVRIVEKVGRLTTIKVVETARMFEATRIVAKVRRFEKLGLEKTLECSSK